MIEGLLRDELGFSGVVITDSTEAAAVLAVSDVARAAVRNVRAGVDVVLTTGRGSYIHVYRRAPRRGEARSGLPRPRAGVGVRVLALQQRLR